MALYHLSVKTVSRSTGRSAVGAAAYRSGTRLTNERDGQTHDYTRRRGVVSSFIVVSAGAGAWAADRSALWNAAEAAESRKNSTVAREYELGLPAELSAEQREALARRFARHLVEQFGVVADVAIHAPGREGDQRNHHAHILTTTRSATEAGLGAKTRALDDRATGPALVGGLRAAWAEQCNAALEQARVTARVDHRSHARQDAERGRDPRDRIIAPGLHLGPIATSIERRTARQRERERGRPPTIAERLEDARIRVSRRGQAADERWQAHVTIGMARAAVREAESDLRGLVKAQEAARQAAAAEAARQAQEAARRAAEAREAARRQRTTRRPVEARVRPTETPEQAKFRRWRTMSVDELRTEIERLRPVNVSDRPGMAELTRKRRAAEDRAKAVQTALEKQERQLERLEETAATWHSQHPILSFLHRADIWRSAEYVTWQRQAGTLVERIGAEKTAYEAATAARDDALRAEETLAAQHRAEREAEVKAVEPDLKALRNLLDEKRERQEELQRDRSRGLERDDELEI